MSSPEDSGSATMMRRTKLLKAAVRDALLVVLISLVAGSVAGAIARVIMRIASLTDEAPGVQGFSVEGTFRLIYLGVILVMASGIALDASQRKASVASWIGIGALLLASAVEWMFLGSGLSLWIWVPIKVLPAIAGLAALLFLAWTPVRERRDGRALFLVRLSLIALVGAAVLTATVGRP